MKSASRTIIFASPVSDFRGGAERSMFELILNTKEHGYRPVVILPRKGEIEKKLKRAGIKTYLINYDWWVRGASEKRVDFTVHRATNGTAVMEMTRIISKEKPFLTVSYTGVIPWLAYASTITRTPHVWQICEILNDTNQWQYRIPLGALMSVIDTMSAKVFANSNACKEQLVYRLPSHAKTIDVIYPFVDQATVVEMGNETRPRLPKDKKIISLVGNIQPTKGQLDAVEAVAKLKAKGHTDILLVLVGNELDQGYVRKIRKIIATNSLADQVIFAGYSPNPHVYTKNSDIALVCSSHEAFGRVTIEAMSLGTPVIGADADGTREIMGDSGRYGLLYSPGDASMLSENILLLLHNDKLRRSLSANAKRYVADNFTREKNQEPFFSFLPAVVNIQVTQKPPFTDIVVAYKHLTDRKNAEIHELRKQNDALATHLHEIVSSKKYKALEKVSKHYKKIKGS